MGVPAGLLMLITVAMVFVGIAIAYYVLYSISLYKMAKKYEIPAPGLAWVPYASYWILGSIADKIKLRSGKKTNSALILTIGHGVFVVALIGLVFSMTLFASMLYYETSVLIGMVISYVLFIGIIIALYVFAYIAYYRIYKDHSDSAVGWLLLSIFEPIAIPFILFSMIKKQSRSEQFVSYSAPQDDNSFYNQ